MLQTIQKAKLKVRFEIHLFKISNWIIGPIPHFIEVSIIGQSWIWNHWWKTYLFMGPSKVVWTNKQKNYLVFTKAVKACTTVYMYGRQAIYFSFCQDIFHISSFGDKPTVEYNKERLQKMFSQYSKVYNLIDKSTKKEGKISTKLYSHQFIEQFINYLSW